MTNIIAVVAENEKIIIPGPARLYAFNCTCSSTSACYIQVFNLNRFPQNTDIILICNRMLNGGSFLGRTFFGDEGLFFSEGISFGYSSSPYAYTLTGIPAGNFHTSFMVG